MKIIPASDSSLLVVFGNAISRDLHDRVIDLFRALREQGDPHIRNLHPGYSSVLIDFDPLQVSHDEMAARVEELVARRRAEIRRTVPVVELPVCYGSEFGPDLPEVAAHAHLSPEEIIQIHSSVIYLVYFLGFSPGFGYLGGLPEKLHTPRLKTPRGHVAAGSVGIAGSQTGIYPVDSPGGWQLIGRTPVRMFDPEATPPTRLQPGDQVKFCPIDRKTYDAMSQRPSH
jgi:KipI family sensor histidine kinase inhibitor